MDSQGQTTSLQRLQNVEKSIVKVLELAGGVMDELASPTGPRKEVVQNHCLDFMQLIKDIQVALRDEIKSACEYRPFEKCDYGSRLSNEICFKKLEFVLSQLDGMKQTIDEYHAAENFSLEEKKNKFKLMRKQNVMAKSGRAGILVGSQDAQSAATGGEVAEDEHVTEEDKMGPPTLRRSTRMKRPTWRVSRND